MTNSFKSGELTVGELLDFIQKNNIPRDARVFYQRIEDKYFTKLGGEITVKKEGEHYASALKFNKNIEDGEFENPNLKPHSEEELESFKEQYIVAQAPVKYKDDDNLYIDAHY